MADLPDPSDSDELYDKIPNMKTLLAETGGGSCPLMPMLRSVKKLCGKKLTARDGEIGNVQDFYFDEQSWEIRKIILDTGNWFSGREIAITPTQIERISYHESRIFVNVTMDAIREAPEFEALALG